MALAGCLILAACYAFHNSLCAGLAHAWIVNEPIIKSDAIVVLGGGLENRPFAAARLFHEGCAPIILYMDVKNGPATTLNITPTEAELTRRILLSNAVPESAICMIGDRVASTYDESRTVRAWLQNSGAKSIIIPTDLFHTRRVRWLFHKELKDMGTRICVVGLDTHEYNAGDWWKNEQGLIAFQNEAIKMIYYWLKY